MLEFMIFHHLKTVHIINYYSNNSNLLFTNIPNYYKSVIGHEQNNLQAS